MMTMIMIMMVMVIVMMMALLLVLLSDDTLDDCQEHGGSMSVAAACEALRVQPPLLRRKFNEVRVAAARQLHVARVS